MKSRGKTDIGKNKGNNEDNYFLNDTLKLYMVSDGMGGHNAGEIASQMVIDSFKKEIIDHNEKNLLNIYNKTNDNIVKKGESDPQYHKMGATLVLLWQDDFKLKLLNLGDSRIYHIFHDKDKKTGIIEQITNDQSRVAELVREGKIGKKEAESHPWKNILSKYFGNKKSNNPEIKEFNLYNGKIMQGDYFVLCSDGLSNMVSDEIMKNKILEQGINAVDDLIDLANNAGGKDNITVIIIEIEEKDIPIYHSKDNFPTFNKLFNLFKGKKRKK